MRMKRVVCLSLAATLACVAGVGWVGENDIKAGLQPGDSPGAFQTRDITGPNKGKSLCYVWANGPRPVAMVFARDITGPLSSLLKQFDTAVAKNKNAEMCSFAVFLTEDADAMEQKIKETAEKEKISENVPLTIVEDVAGPPAYKIDKEAALTVLLYTKGKVVNSYAYKAGQFSDKDVKAIVAQLPKILPSEAEIKAKAEAEAKAKKELEELKKKLEEAKQKAKK